MFLRLHKLLLTSAIVPLGLHRRLQDRMVQGSSPARRRCRGRARPGTVIDQSTQSAIINWQTFNIARGRRRKS